MSMNIGPMIKALIGDGQPVDSRSLELRIGQIVRGVLLEILDGQDALINIGGVQVRAKLEAEMTPGKSTLLQVQSNGVGGQVTLKPLADLSDAIPDSGLKDILKSFGLPEQKWSMEMLRGLKRDGYSIGRETASFFNTAVALKPAGADAASWSGAADVAFRRGLTPTETTLSSLRQALFGQPMHEELSGLRTAVAAWLGSGGPLSPEANALGQKLQSLLAQGASLLAEGEAQLSGEAGGKGSALNRGSAAPDGELPPPAVSLKEAGTGGSTKTAGELGKATAEALRADGGAGRSGAAGANVSANATAAALSASAGSADASSRAQPDAARSAGQSASPPGAQAAAANNAAAANRAAAPAPGATADSLRARTMADAQQPSAPKAEAPWIGRFLQWLGVGHEHKLMLGAEPRLPGDTAGLPAGAAAALLGGADAPSQDARQNAADTLKSALLALSAHDDVPPALREAAQSLANQVTGQQLLLSSERNTSAPFSHMTLFVPMKGSDGDTTATVHVQTRRNRRGEWDVDNCHLLFDLRMRHLGDTLVDVQVVERIVSVKLLNDFPGMADLLNQAREELSAGMSAAGFQLFSLSAAPLPQWKGGSAASAITSSSLEKTTSAGDYATKPYKGVDFRA
ncbi:hypothetical protein [Cohnella sp.]|uniref:hypothetical protein n=1 Tax=Cohnella sp. TaxID=1883426 RepID=UPI00356174FF